MEQMKLNNTSIDRASESVGQFLADAKVERREVLRAKLTLEEVLLKYQERLGEEAPCRVKCVRRFSALRVELVIPGPSFDPFEQEEGELSVLRGLLSGMGLAPTWNYKNGKNYVIFLPRKQNLSQTVKMLLAVGLAVVLGLAFSLLPDAVSGGMTRYVLEPVSGAFMGLISAVSGPLIFLSILGSVCGMGDMETLGRIGKRTVGGLVGIITLTALVMTGILLLAYPLESGGAGKSDPMQLLDMIYGIIPGNFFTPFTEGNALQIIFLAVLVGVAMLLLSTRVSFVSTLVEQLTAIVQTIMGGLAALLPVLVFVMLLNMIIGGQLGMILASWRPILWTICLALGFMVCAVLLTALRQKVSPAVLARKLMPAFLIALTTASSAAAFSTCVKDAEEKLGISPRLVSFAVPMGQILFMPGFVATMASIEFAMARHYGIAITLDWVVIGIVVNVVLSIAAPPVPGGAMTCYSIAFLQLGIPPEAIGLALTMDVILDFVCTAVNFSGMQISLVGIADSLHMLDHEKLRQ